MSTSEDYLDRLLHGIDENEELETEIQSGGAAATNNKATSRETPIMTDEDMIRKFEEELLSDADDLLVDEYERELLSDGPILEETPQTDDDFFRAMDGLLSDNDSKTKSDIAENQSESVSSSISKERMPQQQMPQDIINEEPLPQSQEVLADTIYDAEPVDETSAPDDSFAAENSGDDVPMENESSEPDGYKDADSMGDEDLMNLLSGLDGGDDSLSDIGEMLQSDASGVDKLSEEQIAALEALDGDGNQISTPENGGVLSESGDDSGASSLEEASGKEKKSKKSKKDAKKSKGKETKKSGEKQSFFAKLSKILFGDDEDEVETKVALPSEKPAIEDLSAENLAILKELDQAGEGDNGTELPPEEDKKKKKKEKKEKKEKAPKKEKEPKPKKEKKPKVKKPKEVDNTPPLPKGPVAVIVLFGVSLLALIYLGSNVLGYQMDVDTAKEAFSDGNYQLAYETLAGMTLEEKDTELYNQAKILAEASSQYSAYQTMLGLGDYEMALDCLIRGVGRCDNYAEQADLYGVSEEVSTWRNIYLTELSDQYGVSEEETLSIYDERKRKDYSKDIKQIIKNLGLEQTDDSNH